MKTAIVAAACALSSLAFVGCASKNQEGVTSNLRTQWSAVAADPITTTDAAKAVLEAHGYKEIYANSTTDEGTASGKLSDGTKVKVDVAKEGTASSKVSVTVGTLGSPKLGAELTAEIKAKAQGTAKSDAMKM